MAMRYSSLIWASSLLALTLVTPVSNHLSHAQAAPNRSDAGETVKAEVILDPDQIAESNAEDGDQAALMAALKGYWANYLHMNKTELAKRVTPDFLRMSQRAGSVQTSSTAFIQALSNEWEAFERPDGAIAEKMTLQQLEIAIDDPDSPTSASLRYWVEIEGL